MPMFRLCAGMCEMSSPSTRSTPESAHSNPAAMRSAVVFPHPLGPRRLTSSPGLDGEVEVLERDRRPERLADVES